MLNINMSSVNLISATERIKIKTDFDFTLIILFAALNYLISNFPKSVADYING